MKYFLTILIALIALVSCGNTNDIEKQSDQIVRYLENKGLPYTSFGNAWRQILNSDRVGEFDTIHKGSTFSINFAAYIFTSAPSTLYYTNIRSLFDSKLSGTDTTYWDFNPQEVTLGQTPLLKGLNAALEGCRYGDSLNVFMCSDMAYGEKGSGVVPMNTAVMYSIKILDN